MSSTLKKKSSVPLLAARTRSSSCGRIPSVVCAAPLGLPLLARAAAHQKQIFLPTPPRSVCLPIKAAAGTWRQMHYNGQWACCAIGQKLVEEGQRVGDSCGQAIPTV